MATNQTAIVSSSNSAIRRDARFFSRNPNSLQNNVNSGLQANFNSNNRKSKNRGFLSANKMARQVEGRYNLEDDFEEEFYLSNEVEEYNVFDRRQVSKPVSRQSVLSYPPPKLREQFIQANCQFVVSSSVDCTGFLVDPDTLVPWDNIEQIQYPSTELPQCPICLYTPLVPKMTKCGHIYCWPCALQYLAYRSEEELEKLNVTGVRSGPRSKKCAICAEHFYPEDLRSVLVRPVAAIHPGDILKMQLVQKNKGSTQVMKASSPIPASLPLSPCTDSGQAVFAKVLQASNSELWRMLEREKELLMSARNDPEIQSFVDEAFRSLELRIAAVGEPMEESTSVEKVERLDRIDTSNCSAPFGLDPPRIERSLPVRRAKRTSASEEATYFFYQSADGQPIYLNSINWRCLVAECGGDSSKCPSELECKVLQMDSYQMSAAQRKRHPYLNHLPLSATLFEVELDLRPPLVSRATLKAFEKELSKRRAFRRTRDHKERQHSKRAEEAERRQFGFPVDSILLPSAMYEENPTFTDADPALTVVAQSPVELESASMIRSRSFAEMLKTKNSGKSAPTSAWNRSVPQSSSNPEDDSSTPAPSAIDLGALFDAQLQISGNRQSKQKKNKKK